MEQAQRVNILVHLDGTREKVAPVMPALRWSKDGKLQQAISVNYQKPGGVLGWHIEHAVEWIDVPTEGE